MLLILEGRGEIEGHVFSVKRQQNDDDDDGSLWPNSQNRDGHAM